MSKIKLKKSAKNLVKYYENTLSHKKNKILYT